MDTYKDAVTLNDLWAAGEAPWKVWDASGIDAVMACALVTGGHGFVVAPGSPGVAGAWRHGRVVRPPAHDGRGPRRSGCWESTAT